MDATALRAPPLCLLLTTNPNGLIALTADERTVKEPSDHTILETNKASIS